MRESIRKVLWAAVPSLAGPLFLGVINAGGAIRYEQIGESVHHNGHYVKRVYADRFNPNHIVYAGPFISRTDFYDTNNDGRLDERIDTVATRLAIFERKQAETQNTEAFREANEFYQSRTESLILP